MGHLTYANALTAADRAHMRAVVSAGQAMPRVVRRAHILLFSDAGRSRNEISALLQVAPATVDRIRHRWRSAGREAALEDRPRSGRPPALTPRDEAEIVARARSAPPPGVRRWAHRHLTAVLQAEQRLSGPVSRETVLRCLRRHHVKPWKKGRPGASLR